MGTVRRTSMRDGALTSERADANDFASPGPRTSRIGLIESIEADILSGWAADLTLGSEAASLLLLIDGHVVSYFSCSIPREDVNAAGVGSKTPGFRLQLPDHILDGRPHDIAIRFRSGEQLPYLTPDGVSHIGDLPFCYQLTSITGRIDHLIGSSISGWVFRTDTRTGKRTGNVEIEVRANGVRVDQIKASASRADVAEVFNCEAHCGFHYSLPSRFRDGRTFQLEFHAAREGVPLEGSPFIDRVPVRSTMDQLHSMYAQLEALATQTYALKDQLRELLTQDEYKLGSYNTWAQAYFPTLTARLALARQDARYQELMSAPGPKISVLCPTYKPNLADFLAAVESVKRQSWDNWELIIVDDGSNSRPLTEAINRLCAADKRIRGLTYTKNRGISGATNAAIKMATGDYVALFDHDDLLVDEALEVMVLAARQTNARVLYSDEDKIDAYGNLSEPHLKPDWNYRLALTNNYVCHLLVIEAETLRRVGPLRSNYDGAQDHDLVLRLSETVGPRDIFHVSEILYHWRKVPNSTATQQSAKSYAVEAGRAAVADHVTRRGLKATVSPCYDSTLYDVRFLSDHEPRVCILVPFKDAVEITKQCVECILSNTEYSNYEIVLIDNWSTSPETAAWLATLAPEKRIRIMRIEERFNYSRINNQAAQQLDCDYFLFMNNDIFVKQQNWLRLMVDEALADPTVGVVGIKLLYPNGKVQHAGVVLGVGGVADHAFRFAEQSERGYSFRAVCAQELSAVTAACLLCRADAFREVGMFDEDKLSVAFNDVDLCLKIRRAGFRVIYTPAALVEHHESLSRGSDLADHHRSRFYGENQVMLDRWGAQIRRDPFYNPHFSHETGMFEKLSSASLSVDRAPSLLGLTHAAHGVASQPASINSPASSATHPLPSGRSRRLSKYSKS